MKSKEKYSKPDCFIMVEKWGSIDLAAELYPVETGAIHTVVSCSVYCMCYTFFLIFSVSFA